MSRVTGSRSGGKMLSRIGRGNRLVDGNVELIVTWLWIICALATIVASENKSFYSARYGKRAESRVHSSPFFSGKRYERSEVAGENNLKPQPKIGVSPRADSFYLGSRYGKRTYSNNNDNVNNDSYYKNNNINHSNNDNDNDNNNSINNDDNNNINNNDDNQRQLKAATFLRRFVEALGYIDRLERNGDEDRRNNVFLRATDDYDTPREITNDNELDNFW